MCRLISKSAAIAVATLFISIATYRYMQWVNQIQLVSTDPPIHVCVEDISKKTFICRPSCKHGYFSFPGMKECVPWIRCDSLKNIPRLEMVGEGAVKKVNKGRWNGYDVAVNTLRNDNFKIDFLHGLDMLRQFQPHEVVVQLIGWCDDTYVTEYHPLGSADQLNNVLDLPPYVPHNTLLQRFRTCISYVKAIRFLHSSPMGTRVMCDSNEPDKTLSQFLITSDLDLVLNDLDALPEVNSAQKSKCKCGHRELYGDFVAPEQLWPFEGVEFDDDLMPGYDERTDIWKIPDVCNTLLGTEANRLRLYLLEIHGRCKEDIPSLRPTVDDVLGVYTDIYETLGENRKTR